MNTNNFENILKKYAKKPLFILDKKYNLQDYHLINISETNQDLKNFDTTSANSWEKYINIYLEKNKAKVAFGGYLEKRNLYDRSEYFSNQSENEKRNIHLGIDLWCEAETKVLSVLDGEIHSFKNNKNYGDYGPTIILKHQIENEIFYTLYGHLSLASIEYINVGDKVEQGQQIATLGDESINGNYAPHLHFQIIKDLQNNFGDYAGVSSKNDLEFYKENCPNPNLLLKLK